MKALLKIFVILSILFMTSPAYAGGWLIYYDTSYTGKVVDAETNQPIEEVAVLGVWYLQRFGGAGGPLAKFFDAKETVTDKNGEFTVPGVIGFHWWPFTKMYRPRFIIYKPGYDSYPPYDLMRPGITGMEQQGFLEHKGNIVKLPRVKNKQERMKALVSVSICGDVPDNICIPRKKASKTISIIEAEAKELGLLR